MASSLAPAALVSHDELKTGIMGTRSVIHVTPKHQTPLLKTALELRAAGSLFLRDVAQGAKLLFSHNTLALVGLPCWRLPSCLAVRRTCGCGRVCRPGLAARAHEARAAAEGDVLSVTAEPDAISAPRC